jgi:hypothetical protein
MRPGAMTPAARGAASTPGTASAGRPAGAGKPSSARKPLSARKASSARTAATTRDAGAKRDPDRRQSARTATDAPREHRGSSPRPRRLSGPIGGKGGASRASSAAAARSSSPAPRIARPSLPSLSGAVAAAVALPLPFRPQPARQRPQPVRERPQPARDRVAKPATGISRRIGAFVLSLPDHHLLDRVIRGRAWIPLLGVLLAGIVATQVEILKLGASMGRSLEQTSSLTGQNEQLRDSVAALSDDQRIERLATAMGLVLPPPGAVGYLPASRGGDVARAVANIHTPDTAGFLALAASNGALVTGPGASMLPANPTTVLAQAGTPGSATPTSTSSPTQAIASAGATNSTSTTSATQAPPAEQAPPATTSTETPATTTSSPTTSTDSQSATTAPQTTQPTQTTSTGTQGPATGAAAIGPATSTQPGSGG